jgi:hypothetical protein
LEAAIAEDYVVKRIATSRLVTTPPRQLVYWAATGLES